MTKAGRPELTDGMGIAFTESCENKQQKFVINRSELASNCFALG